MQIPRVLHFFQRGSTEKEVELSTFTGKMWVNYTDKINSLHPTRYSSINTFTKIAMYMSTIFFIATASIPTLLVDGAGQSLDLLKNAYETASERFFQRKVDHTKRNVTIATGLITSTVGITFSAKSYGFI